MGDARPAIAAEPAKTLIARVGSPLDGLRRALGERERGFRNGCRYDESAASDFLAIRLMAIVNHQWRRGEKCRRSGFRHAAPALAGLPELRRLQFPD